MTVDYDSQNVAVTIEDDGPGYAHDVLARIGEPYVTERHNDTRAGGLGLGLFIAKTLLERSGATVTFENRGLSGTGARVTIIWPRALMDDKETVDFTIHVEAAIRRKPTKLPKGLRHDDRRPDPHQRDNG